MQQVVGEMMDKYNFDTMASVPNCSMMNTDSTITYLRVHPQANLALNSNSLQNAGSCTTPAQC